MSRVGKKPITIPDGVDVFLEGDSVTAKGPKGELRRRIHPSIKVNIDGRTITLTPSDESKESISLHGLSRMLVDNMVTGVSSGFQKVLEIVGVGYRAEMKGRTAVLNLGYSHPVEYPLPEGIEATVDRGKMTVSGIDKELLGLTCAKIRGLRPPEPYKGKGIRYAGEMVRRKAGKAGA
ncbi:MAG TPA: 50S ribosomal protein L6 [Desulfobacteraceae bacterium]|nr:50S ribosomal protein L6 [Desulfobacteraceae bacterium]